MTARSQFLAVLSIALLASALAGGSPTPAAPRASAPAPAHEPALAAALAQSLQLQLARQWSAADSVAASALQHAEQAQPSDSSAMATALYYRANIGMALARLTDPTTPAYAARSVAILQRMARPDTLEWIGAEWLVGKIQLELERPDSALHHLALARSLCRPSLKGADSLLAEVWISTGRTYRRAGRADSSLACFETARRLHERHYGPDHPAAAIALAELGASLANLDRLDEARESIVQAVQLLERTRGPDSPELATPLGQLANVQYLSGDIAGSIETLDRVVVIRSRVDGFDSPRTIPARHAIALRLFDFGDYAGARARLEALLPPAEAAFGAGNTRTESVRMLAGAAAVLMGDTTAAARYLIPAQAALTNGPLDAQHLGTYVERWYSMLLMRRGDLAGAERSIADGLAREHASQRSALPALMNLLEGALEIRMARADSAAVDSTLAEMKAMYPDRTQEGTVAYNNILRLRARGEAWRGRRAAAWQLALDAERLERTRLVLNVRTLDDRRALELAGQVAEPLDQLVSLAHADDSAAVAVAWDRVVRWRGLVAAEVAGRRAPPQASADTTLLAAHQRWLNARRQNARIEVSSAGNGVAVAERLAGSRALAQEEERRYAALCAERGIARDTASVDLARLRGALRPDQALVSLVEVDPHGPDARMFAFETSGPRGELHLFDLGPSQTLRPKVAAWRAALATPPAAGREREAEQTCRRLGDAVRACTWDVLRPELGEARLVVLVADGVLAELPWEALPVGSDRYLVDVGPELQLPGAEREVLWPSPSPGRGLLAIGDPDFDAAAELPAVAEGTTVLAMRGPLGECASLGSLALQPLPGARAEVAEVVATWDVAHPGAGVRPRLGPQATESAFKALAPGCEVLHIATHGIVWGDSCGPLRAGLRGVGGVGPLEPSPPKSGPGDSEASSSGASPSPWAGRQVWLALAGANHAGRGSPDENEGLLTADEVVTLDLRGVDWVVLSACQSAAGAQWPREGSIGMRRAFRLAGARTVIASQWPIADEATRDWMRALYGARAAGHARAFEATRDASRVVLGARRKAGRTTHPFYWAAFTSTGP